MRSEVSGIDLTSETKNTLSVVIPLGFAVNQLSTLRNSLASASSDTEIIIVNDLACEDSSELIGAICEEYPRLNIQSETGYFGSPGGARNAGLTNASKEFVYFADSDDFIHFGTIEQSLKKVTHDVEVLIGNFHQEKVGGQEITEYRIKKPEYLSIGINPGIWRMIFRKCVLSSFPFSSLRMAEDQVFLAQLSLFERKIQFVDRVFYTYRKGVPSSLTSQVENFEDLPQALTMINACLNKELSLSNRFNLIMFSRVLLTSQLRSNSRIRVRCILLFCRISLTSVRTLPLVLMAPSEVTLELIKNRRKNAN